jgi:glycolate oxidase
MATIAASLVRELRVICGTEGVLTDPERLLVYECDAYTMEKHLPDAVVLPRNTEETVEVVKISAAHKVRFEQAWARLVAPTSP